MNRIFVVSIVYVLFFVFGSVPVRGGGPFPYIATVAQDSTEVRSGPGDEYYATSHLKAGEKIEIYQHTEDGWCAIRPPLGSFSWVSGSYVRLDIDNIGTINAEGLASRIGSLLEDECKTVQVRFRKGEKIYVIERMETPENRTSPFWYKIAPPKGEYRWVHQCCISGNKACQASHAKIQQPIETVSNDPPLVVPSMIREDYPRARPLSEHTVAKPDPRGIKIKSMPSPEIAQARYMEQFDDYPVEMQETEIPNIIHDETGFEAVALPRNDITAEPKKVTRRPPAEMNSGEFERVISIGTAPIHVSANDTIREGDIRLENIDPFIAEFIELQSEVFNVMSEPTEDWVFEELIVRGKTLYRTAETESEKYKVQRLIDALEKTKTTRQELKMFRYQDAIQKGKPLPSRGTQTTITRASHSNVSPQQSASTQKKKHPFHAIGRLGRITNNQLDGLPPYALIDPTALDDENRRVICYVSPDDGVDLNQHVGRYVGMNGQPGLFQKDGKPHLTAKTVFVLEK